MVELMTICAVLLAIVFLIACLFIRSEFWRLTQDLNHSHKAVGELTERHEEVLRKNRNLQDEMRKTAVYIQTLEYKLARLNEFREAVKTASATLDGDEE